jgi:hypothetical protein
LSWYIDPYSGTRNIALLRLADGQIDLKEDVELDEGGEREENGVQRQAHEADPLVQPELVAAEGDEEQQRGREQRQRAVLETVRVDDDGALKLLARARWLARGRRAGQHRRLDQPGHTQAQQDVERVRADRVADAHSSVT